MKVIDASVTIPLLVSDDHLGQRAREALRGQTLAAPELLDLEVGSGVRRQTLAGHLDQLEASVAIERLRELPIRRQSHRPLLWRCWELRDNVSFYDAAYVALAELLHAPLVTAEARLANASGPRCEFELLS